MKNLNRLALIFFVFASLWSLGGSIFLLASPLTIHVISAENIANGSEIVEEVTRPASWYEVQGLWGVIILLIFSLLYFSVAFLAYKEKYIPLAVASFLAVTLTFLAGLSVGPVYLPAALAVLVGWLLLGLARIFPGRKMSSGEMG